MGRNKLSAKADLERVSAFFALIVPDAKCALWDYGAKLRCGIDDIIEVRFTRNGLSDESIRKYAEKLSAKIAARKV